MKRMFPFILLVTALCARGQNYLGISKVITGFQDTVAVNQSVSYQVYVKNYGPGVFSGFFNINTWVDSSTAGTNFHFSRLDTLLNPVTINPGDSVQFNTGDTYDLSTYRLTGNVVVIWPRTYQPGWSTLDSVFHDVYLKGMMDVNEPGQEPLVKIWPNPVQCHLYLDRGLGKDPFEDVRITDHLGQAVPVAFGHDGIDVSALPAGIYFLWVRTRHGVQALKFAKVVE